jgi:hypothetical protein
MPHQHSLNNRKQLHAVQAWAAALASAELAVGEAWQEAVLDYDRAAAQQQQQQRDATAAAAPNCSSSSSSVARPQKPQVELQGHLLSVAIPILPDADVAGLVALIDEAVDALAAASSSSSCSQSTRLLGTSRVMQWESSRTLRQPPKSTTTSSSSSREQLRVQVMVPLQHSSPHEDSSSGSSSSSSSEAGVAGYGRVSVVKPGSAFTGDELALLARLVAAANKPAAGGVSGVKRLADVKALYAAAGRRAFRVCYCVSCSVANQQLVLQDPSQICCGSMHR